MKKLATLLIAAGMVVSSFAGASAAEFKPSASFINQYTFGTTGDSDLVGNKANFVARTQIQLGFDYIASENLSGTFLMRVRQHYGSGEFDGQWATHENGVGSGGSIYVRLAYIDWMIPNTDVSVRMGYQPVSLPAFAFGSAVLDARGSGITVNAPINENIAVTALWTRMLNNDDATETGDNYYADLFAVVADFNYDGFRIAPWIAYANMKTTGTFPGISDLDTDSVLDGVFADAKISAWLIGASFELSMFDPFTFALDAYYSNVSADQRATSGDYDADGFFIGASASYKLDFATPSLKAWYASGADQRDNGNQDEFIGAMYLAPCFGATSIMFDNYIMTDGYVEQANGGSPSGLWGIMLDVSDISFIENLSHQFVIAYMQGTNDLDNGSGVNGGTSLNMLGKDDSVIEVNFNSTYQIYKNLSTTLQLGWLAPNFELDGTANYEDLNDDILRAAISFTYKF